jgi:hypothetical protein
MKELRFVSAGDKLAKAVSAIQIMTVKQEIFESKFDKLPDFGQRKSVPQKFLK